MRTRIPRILTVIFPSNYPNFAADSIYQFNRSLFQVMANDRRVEVFAAGLPDMPPLGEKIRTVPFTHGINKFEVRFSFPWGEMRQILQEVRPDICLVNMPEQASALSILARDELGLACRIVSYVHYIPAGFDPDAADAEVRYEASMDGNGHGRLFILRLLEGVVASDLVLICSHFGVRLLQNLAGRHLHVEVKLPPIRRLPPPVDFSEVDSSQRPAVTDEPRFVYNHRLYGEYGTQKIFHLLRRISETEPRRFKVLVTNPTEARDVRRSKINPIVEENLSQIRALGFVEQTHFTDRVAYFHALSSSWAGIGPFKPHSLWSMSVMDMLACGRPVLAFDVASFREMGLPDNLLVRDEDAFEQAFRGLLTQRPEESERQRYRNIAALFNRQRISDEFLTLIGGL